MNPKYVKLYLQYTGWMFQNGEFLKITLDMIMLLEFMNSTRFGLVNWSVLCLHMFHQTSPWPSIVPFSPKKRTVYQNWTNYEKVALKRSVCSISFLPRHHGFNHKNICSCLKFVIITSLWLLFGHEWGDPFYYIQIARLKLYSMLDISFQI